MDLRLAGPLSWSPKPSATFVGIDGAKGGWVVASIKGNTVTLTIVSSIHEVHLPKLHRALVDMPIGLPDSARRACDSHARALLGTRRSTIFSVPTRKAIYAPSYPEACTINEKLQGVKLSKQLWNITPKIKETDAFLRRNPSLNDSFAEGHPELAFLALSKSPEPLSPKRTDEGRSQRVAILRHYLPSSFYHTVERCRALHPKALDLPDILDALALATLLYRSSGAVDFVGDGSLDAHGNPCRICYR